MTTTGKPGASAAFVTMSGKRDLLKMDFSKKKSASLKEYTISPSHPSAIDWTRQPYTKVKIYRNVCIKNNVSGLQEPLKMGLLKFIDVASGNLGPCLTDKIFQSTMLMHRAPSPFAEGEICLAYHGQLVKAEKDLGKKDHKMVMKSFKHLGRGVNDRDQYLKQMAVPISWQKNIMDSRISLPTVTMYMCCLWLSSEKRMRQMKTHLPSGVWRNGCCEVVKYNSNTGYWDEDCINETLLCFTTKFTHDVTHGYIFVSDLQGVRKGNNYHLIDPVILCKDILHFGNTNLGKNFVKKVLIQRVAI